MDFPAHSRSWLRCGVRGTLLFAVIVSVFPAYAQSRFQGGGFGTYSFLKEIGSRDTGVGTEVAGIGGRFVYRALPHLDLESDLALLPGNSATIGNLVQGLFGTKLGVRSERVGLFVKARAGFLHFRRDPFGVRAPGTTFFSHARAPCTEPNADIGGVLEFYTRRGLILRLDIGDSIVRYGRRTVQVSEALPPTQAGGFTTQNLQVSLGIGIRFPR